MALSHDTLEHIERIAGHRFTATQTLEQALTHSSAAGGRIHSNERLEFLGDSVLGFLVCEHLFRSRNDLLEGELTKIKSTIVSGRVCAELAQECGLDRFVRVDKGVRGRTGLPESLVAGVFEAVVAAVFLDGGLDAARGFVMPLLAERIEEAARLGHQDNFKQVLQQSLAQLALGLPQYVVLDEKGPDHAKAFEICVEAAARKFPSAWGPSKKQAEQLAALAALRELNIAHDDGEGGIRIVWPS
jgi:ribonuclease-3